VGPGGLEPPTYGLKERGLRDQPSQVVVDTEPSSTPELVPHEAAPIQDPPGAFSNEAVDVVEAALAEALLRAAHAGQWEIVSQLARELDARRMARSATNVMKLPPRNRKS
jgi:hypothetical protein